MHRDFKELLSAFNEASWRTRLLDDPEIAGALRFRVRQRHDRSGTTRTRRPKGGPEAIETSLIGGSATRNSTPQLTEIDHCVEITFLQDAVIDAVDVDEDRSEGVVARFRNAADLAIDLRDHGAL